jgi:hypothetical protein
MDTFQGFPLIQAIFYCEFHPTQGPKVVFEVPEGFTASIHSPQSKQPNNISMDDYLHMRSPAFIGGNPSNPSTDVQPRKYSSGSLSSFPAFRLLDFDSISEYLIPKPEICNRLVMISTGHFKVLGYPVSIESAKYERNALLFNLCFVFHRGADTASFVPVVKKTARVLRSSEVCAPRTPFERFLTL